MPRRILPFLILSLWLSSCGGAAPAVEQPANEPATQTLIPEATVTSAPTQTFTPAATLTPSITPTETLLPLLILPTEMVNAPSLLAWDGTPTYLGDSKPGYFFRVLYDPQVWALTPDQFGYPAIAHRAIPYCVISVTSGRGLPANISVEQNILYLNNITYYAATAYENSVKKFVTYTGGDGTILTAFEVSFEEQSDQCIADAETVLATLRSVPVSQATPEP